MIIFRYLLSELGKTTFAVVTVLLLIVSSGRLAKYLSEVSTGGLSADVVFWVILFRIPDFLPLIVPLGLFVGILLAYGRLYVDSEMTVMSACGISKSRLLATTLFAALLVSMFVAFLTLSAAPASLAKVQSLLQDPAHTQALAILQERRFQSADDGRRVSYAQSLNNTRDAVDDVWLFEKQADGLLIVISARSGKIDGNSQTGHFYFTLVDGTAYEGTVGDRDYRVTDFATYGQKILTKENTEKVKLKVDAMPTRTLFASSEPRHVAALHWRFSLPIAVIVVAIMAHALSKTSHRAGRFTKMLPAILLYLIYIMLISSVRNSIASGDFPALLLWLAHAVFGLLAIGLLLYEDLRRNWRAIPASGGAR